MYLKGIELSGFKSFAKKSELEFATSIAAIVGPNGSGKSNIAEGFRFVLGEQSIKSMRGKRGEDLIWGGSEHMARTNRATVKVTFDNSPAGGARLFDIDFDEVTIGRTVHRDGVNQYLINGSQVRLKDIAELLAGANIGSSGHHIISQGEADRLLSASTKERREMIEDALGLKIFQYKKKESERKLEQTTDNINQVQSLRKEIAPHLKFLKRQVEKIEKSKQMRDELSEFLREYLKREELYIKNTRKEIEHKKHEPSKSLASLEAKLKEARSILEKVSRGDNRGQEILDVEQKLSDTRKKRDLLSRDIGRIEGQIAFAEKHPVVTAEEAVSLADVKALQEEIEQALNDAEGADTLILIKEKFLRIREIFASFFKKREKKEKTQAEEGTEELKEQKVMIDARFKEIEGEERAYAARYKALQDEIETSKDEGREAERDVFKITAEKSAVLSVLHDLARDEELLRQIEAEWKRDLEEGAALVGRIVLEYDKVSVPEDVMLEGRGEQEKRKREIEKIKIRLEEFGGGSGDEILKEYKDASERDLFFEREIGDLEKSAETLTQLIAELDLKLAIKFREGISKINKEFQHFFALLFGGGTASLAVLETKKKKRASESLLLEEESTEIPQEEEAETGIDINVSLPRKKIKGLQMLSGGERALTSIALLFAMSQVNPPPFLILDETDAALDEANSRKYSQMIRDLSKKTQLIVITHNRETMSSAGILYGITMGSDGVSKLLSVKFEEAVAVAK